MFTAINHAATAVRQRLVREQNGATAVEYGLIVGLIAVVLIVAVTALSGALGDLFDGVTGVLQDNVPESPTTP